jgi:hypothetical protein
MFAKKKSVETTTVVRVEIILKDMERDISLDHFFDFSSEDFHEPKAVAAQFIKDFQDEGHAITFDKFGYLRKSFKVEDLEAYDIVDIDVKTYISKK